MPRFYYEFVELEAAGDDSREFTYVLYDRRRGDHELARCEHVADAEKIVHELNRGARDIFA